MRKTTVYLTEQEAEALRRTAAASGRSQADLIREAVRLVTSGEPRRFKSMGMGRGTGEPVGRNADEILRSELKPHP